MELKFNNYQEYLNDLRNCSRCKSMQGKPVIGSLKEANIISIGQAPGIHEEKFGKPFAYTAGKTLFKWFRSIGIEEEKYRQKVNMSAVCRCFPGKAKNGDRKPNKEEISNCSIFLNYEFIYHKPKLVIPIGKLAIDILISNNNYKLDEVIGKIYKYSNSRIEFDWIPLPHPSGLNVWNNTETGKKLIHKSLNLIEKHPIIIKEFF